jgi:hypothetical protein
VRLGRILAEAVRRRFGAGGRREEEKGEKQQKDGAQLGLIGQARLHWKKGGGEEERVVTDRAHDGERRR